MTSGMFPRRVPTAQTRPFVRYHFLGLIYSWGPVGTRMVDYQSTPAHRPTFCWGCKTDTHMVDAKLQPLLSIYLSADGVLPSFQRQAYL